jgi:sulfite exporter TauE/SafE
LQDTSRIFAFPFAELPSLPDPKFGTDPGPYLTLLVVGFVVGALGHLFRSKTIVASGIIMIVAATILLPVMLQLSR